MSNLEEFYVDEKAARNYDIRNSPTRHLCYCGSPWSDSGYVGYLNTYREVVSIQLAVHYMNPTVLVNNPWCSIRAVYASKPGATTSLPELLKDHCWVVRGTMAQHASLSNAELEALAVDAHISVRRIVWERDDITTSLRQMLAEEFG